MFLDQPDGFLGSGNALWNRTIARVGQRRIEGEHGRTGPFDKPWPEMADQDQGRVTQVSDL